eukprot:gene10586-10744_t
MALLPWALHHRHAVRVPVQALLHVIFSRHMPSIRRHLGDQDGLLLKQHETSIEGVFGVSEDDLASLCDAEGDAWGLAALFDDASISRVEAVVASRMSQPGLVVCASLLDNLPNLAGLCRTCESLSTEALVLSSRSLAATDAFKRQSVTSERWIQLLEVGASDVATFLQERQASGYSIIGVEQTTNSIPLQDFSFPPCCVLLLGNEQNGIPVELLPLLDVCVEIPMLGVTRSLNAHVSGAMAVWQYTQQQLMTGPEPS